MLRADLARPLPPGATTALEVAFQFEVPEHGSDRMGRQQFSGGWLYEIAQWYPRMAVYDDVRRLEHRAVPGSGRVLPRVMVTSTSRSPYRAASW